MAEAETENSMVARAAVTPDPGGAPVVDRMSKLPVLRQIGVMLGLALSVAIGVAAVLWSQTPEYSLLYASVADKDVSEVLNALDGLGVDYRVESSSGAIMVAEENVHEARLKLAAQGYPRSDSMGFELLEKDSGFGTSRKMETARFQHALENEIARSITSIQNVKTARVHLALPKQSVFIRQRKKPSASILVNLYSGRVLEKEQVEAIVHLVASSVPRLEPGQVTVVDQRGRLLNGRDQSAGALLSTRQFEYKKTMEDHLIRRVENILSPLVGEEGLRTQVTADIDFSTVERTQEQYNPDLPALRSEQTQEQSSQSGAAQGVPGALSNQPPAAGRAPEEAGGTASESGGENETPSNSSRSATRNYELDKTISHTRLASGEVRRLTIAVVIDDRPFVQEGGTIVKKPYSQEDLERFTDLVKGAVGFDIARGDQVTVTNSAFRSPEIAEALPELPIWEQPWFRSLLKQLAAVLVVVALVFGVLRPFMRSLATPQTPEPTGAAAAIAGGAIPALAAVPGQEGAAGAEESAEDQDLLMLEAPQSYEKRLEFAQKMVDDDPKRVAQVLKNWVTTDG